MTSTTTANAATPTALTCDVLLEGVATAPAQKRTRLDSAGQSIPVLQVTLRTPEGRTVQACQDYPVMCHDIAERDAKRIKAGTPLQITAALAHVHLCAHHASITIQDPSANPEASPQKEIF
jgi:hypothetical protein